MKSILIVTFIFDSQMLLLRIFFYVYIFLGYKFSVDNSSLLWILVIFYGTLFKSSRNLNSFGKLADITDQIL